MAASQSGAELPVLHKALKQGLILKASTAKNKRKLETPHSSESEHNGNQTHVEKQDDPKFCPTAVLQEKDALKLKFPLSCFSAPNAAASVM